MEKIADREDITVERDVRGVTKRAHTDQGKTELANEMRFLDALRGTPYVPPLLGLDYDEELTLQDIGDGEPVRDEARFLRHCIGLLHAFRARGICHGDLTAKNLIVRGDYPVAIDFGESRFADEGGPHKRPKPDAYYFWRAINEIHPMRQVERWIAVRGALGGDEDDAWDCLAGRNVLDLGCHTGETTAMAAAEGAAAVGVDNQADAIMRAREVWHPYGCQFLQADLVGYEPEAADIVFLFSTWAYIVQDHGREVAEETLARLVARSQVLFFETQLRGDGPGPDFLESNTDVAVMLNRLGKIEALTTTPVAGRDAWRTVWSVKPR